MVRGQRKVELHGLGLGPWPKGIQSGSYQRCRRYVLAVFEALRRKHGYSRDDEIPAPQISALSYSAKCYKEELLLEETLMEKWDELSYVTRRDLLKEIRLASCRRHGALLKLGISEKEAGTDAMTFKDGEDEE